MGGPHPLAGKGPAEVTQSGCAKDWLEEIRPVCRELAAELQLGPIIKRKLITSAHGHTVRPVMEARIKIGKKKLKSEFTIADRSHMRYKILVGQNILKQGFLIDPMKKVKK